YVVGDGISPFGTFFSGLLSSLGVTCYAPASQGQLTIPAEVVAAAVGPAPPPILPIALTITRRNDSPLVFPITDPQGATGVGYFTYTRQQTILLPVAQSQ
ncbi:MAG: hypothetical protein ABI165_11100, partial [Bryobacteraceae bacterium]